MFGRTLGQAFGGVRLERGSRIEDLVDNKVDSAMRKLTCVCCNNCRNVE
jgi:hypothetical protein